MLTVNSRLREQTRYSMLETIRQFAEEQLVARGEAEEVRAAHARHFAGREADVMAVWDGSRQREAYAWFTVELANLRAAFRWAADHHDLDTASALAIYATFFGAFVEQYEPVAWAEELIEPARAVEHRRLAQLYVMAAHCYVAGRVDDALGYSEASQLLRESGCFDEVPDVAQALLGAAYASKGRPELAVEFCRNIIAQSSDPHTSIRVLLTMALTVAAAHEEAEAACDGLLADAEATRNPYVMSFAFLAYGFAYLDADPVVAYEACRLGLAIAQDSGNQNLVSVIAVVLSRLATTHGDHVDAFDFLTLSIRNYHDTGNLSLLRGPLAVLAAFLDRLGHYEPAATISGFAASPYSRTSFPEINTAITHLRDVLGEATYESLARKGETMTTTAMATYAYDQIDQARAELKTVSK
jgi:hypothetical protein